MIGKKYGYKVKLIMAFAVFNLLCILLTSISFYGMSNRNLKNNYSEIVRGELRESKKNINQKTDYIEYLAKSYIIDETFYANMSREYNAFEGSNILTSYLLPKGRNMVALSIVDVEMTLYLENNSIPEHYYTEDTEVKRTFSVKNVRRIKEKDFYKICKENFAYMKWMQIDDDAEKGKMSLVTKLGCMAGEKEIGILVIKSSLDELIDNSVPSKNEKELYYEVLDENNKVLLSSFDRSDVKLSKKFDEQRIFENTHNDWNISIYMPVSNIASGRAQILQIIIIMGLIIFVCNLLIGKLLAERMYKNVSNILSGIDIYRQGEYEHRIQITDDDEFKEIAESINGFAAEIQHLIDDVYEGMLQRQDIEFQMLRAKINPHFLCNIFNLVVQMAENGSRDEIIELSQKTSSFYRRILKKNDNYIRVMDEKNALENYFEIMDIIKSRSINIIWDIQSGAERCVIPTFLMQPIVENSIQHGMIEDSIEIRIAAEIKEDELVITIRDNGVGMTLEQKNDMFKLKQNGGYGLYNIRSRMKLKYPEDEYGIFVTSELGKGTEVKLVFPISYENEEDL